MLCTVLEFVMGPPIARMEKMKQKICVSVRHTIHYICIKYLCMIIILLYVHTYEYYVCMCIYCIFRYAIGCISYIMMIYTLVMHACVYM